MAFLNKIKTFVKNKSSKSPAISIHAPLSGEIVPIEEVPDVVFADKIVGDGCRDYAFRGYDGGALRWYYRQNI